MITKSPSRKTRLLPTGGCKAARLSLIHCRKLNDRNGCIQCVLDALFAYVTRSKPTPRGPEGRAVRSLIHDKRCSPRDAHCDLNLSAGRPGGGRRLQSYALTPLAMASEAAATPGGSARAHHHDA